MQDASTELERSGSDFHGGSGSRLSPVSDLRNALRSWELSPRLRGDAVGDRAVVAGDGGRGVVNLVDDHGEGATPTAMAIMGWSSAAMATRYQHVLDSILKGVAGQVGGLLWDDHENDPADDGKQIGDDGTAGVLVPT